MSVEGRLIILRDVAEFSVESAEFIALAVARGEAVKDLHDHCPELCPSPLVVNRWRRNVPAFDMVMMEAETARAQGMADEVIKIADDPELQAAQARNAIEARKWLAGKLDVRYGSNAVAAVAPVSITNMVMLSDEQLMKIAGGAIDGEYARLGEEAGPEDVEDSWGFLT